MRRISSVFILAILLCLPLYSASAEEKKAEKENPVIAAHKKFTEGLDETSARHFGVVYSNYNLVQVVETVKDSVNKAVDACGEKHADLKDPLASRFEEWTDAVDPVLEEASGHIDNMVIAQDYAEPKEIKKLFRLIDKTRAEQEEQAEKVPSTTEKSCKFLLKQMDKTQGSMVKLLRSTLISLPMTIQQEHEAEKKAAEEDAQQAKAEQAEETSE